MFRFLRFYSNKDEQSGGGGAGSSGAGAANTGEDGSSTSGEGDGTSKAGEQGSSSSGKKSDEQVRAEFNAEQQAVLNRELRRAEDRGKKKAADDAANAKAVEEGRFKDLHEIAQKRIVEELEPAAARATALSERVNSSVDAEIKDWPDSVKKTDPGKDDVLRRVEWVDSHRDMAKDIAGSKVAPEGEHGGGSSVKPPGKSPVALMSSKYRTPGAAPK